jgi:hypothetical protein
MTKEETVKLVEMVKEALRAMRMPRGVPVVTMVKEAFEVLVDERAKNIVTMLQGEYILVQRPELTDEGEAASVEIETLCYCGADLIVIDAKRPAVVHVEPQCEDFKKRDVLEYLRWLNTKLLDVRQS